MIKNIFKIILIFLLTSIPAFANTSLELKSSDESISLDDYFNLEIILNNDSDFKGGEIKILGLEDFNKISQKESSQFTSVNGETQNSQIITLSLKANKIGKFIIGPAIIGEGDEKIESNSVDIKILESAKKVVEENKVLDEEFEGNDIKGIKQNFDIYGKLNYIPLILLLIFILYIIYFKFFKNAEQVIEVKKVEKFNLEKEKKKLISELKKLKKNQNEINKSEFFEKLNSLFRKYFYFLGVIDSETLTLKELKNKKIDSSLLSLFEKSYLNEFSDKDYSEEEKEKLIDDFIVILQK